MLSACANTFTQQIQEVQEDPFSSLLKKEELPPARFELLITPGPFSAGRALPDTFNYGRNCCSLVPKQPYDRDNERREIFSPTFRKKIGAILCLCQHTYAMESKNAGRPVYRGI